MMAGKALRSINHYQALNVPLDASAEGIRSAYRAAVLQLHPDKAGAEPKDWQKTAEFLRVQNAWEVLKDPQKRAAYNQLLLAEALHKELAVSAEVDLDDMACHEDSTGTLFTFSHPCRCGSSFTLSETDLSDNADNVLVQCQNCSLAIRVLYTVQPMDGP